MVKRVARQHEAGSMICFFRGLVQKMAKDQAQVQAQQLYDQTYGAHANHLLLHFLKASPQRAEACARSNECVSEQA